MALLTGNNLTLYFDVVPVGNTTSASISYTASMMDVTTEDTRTFAEFIPKLKSSTLNFSKLHTFEETLEVGDKLVFHLGLRSSGFTGECIIESINIEASSDEVQTYQGTAKITGELMKFIPEFEENTLCTTDGREICTTGGVTICVSEQIN